MSLSAKDTIKIKLGRLEEGLPGLSDIINLDCIFKKGVFTIL